MKNFVLIAEIQDRLQFAHLEKMGGTPQDACQHKFVLLFFRPRIGEANCAHVLISFHLITFCLAVQISFKGTPSHDEASASLFSPGSTGTRRRRLFNALAFLFACFSAGFGWSSTLGNRRNSNTSCRTPASFGIQTGVSTTWARTKTSGTS